MRLRLDGFDSFANAVDASATDPDAFSTVSIDDYCEAGGLRIGLIQLDIEGAELGALRGARRILAGDRPHIVFEVHRHYVDWSRGLAQTEICAFLAELGYTLYAVRDFNSHREMGERPIELVPQDKVYLDGPPHGFNMLAVQDPGRVAGRAFASSRASARSCWPTRTRPCTTRRAVSDAADRAQDAMTTQVATLIGGHGFIGRGCTRGSQREGWSCWLPRRDDPELWPRPLGHVFHCAGLTADYAERPFDTVEAHASLLDRLLRDARFDSLVYLSSTRLYDSLGAVDATEELPLCLSPDNPRHLYDLSKALGESLCRVAGGAGRAWRACRACGARRADAKGFLPDVLRQGAGARAAGSASDRRAISVATSPAFVRDYVHVDDVVEGLLHSRRARGFGIYNVAGGQQHRQRPAARPFGKGRRLRARRDRRQHGSPPRASRSSACAMRSDGSRPACSSAPPISSGGGCACSRLVNMDRGALLRYVERQLGHFFPDEAPGVGAAIDAGLDPALARLNAASTPCACGRAASSTSCTRRPSGCRPWAP